MEGELLRGAPLAGDDQVLDKIAPGRPGGGLPAPARQRASAEAGAVLGPFKGEVAGLGGQVAHISKIAGRIPAALRLHAITEFAARNRLGRDAVFLDVSMPLWVKPPPAPDLRTCRLTVAGLRGSVRGWRR